MQTCLQDIRYHLSYLAESVSLKSRSLFEDYMSWVKSLLGSLGLPEEDMLINLQCMSEVLSRELPSEYAVIACEYLDKTRLEYKDIPLKAQESFLEGSPYAELARRYLQALLDGRRHEASRMIMEALEEGTTVKDIYLHVLQPSQRELGRLWQLNRVSVAQEHYCTAATQLIMSQFYPLIFREERKGLRLVAACPADELHELGLRMVSDLLELEGWDTYYLGPNVPLSGILRTVEERRPHILALSVTITYHVGEVLAVIEGVRSMAGTGDLKVMVGGYPFNIDKGLWKTLGADGWAPDAGEATVLAEKLVGV